MNAWSEQPPRTRTGLSFVPYWKFMTYAFARSLSYRVNILMGILGNIVNLVIQISIWHTLLGSRSVTNTTIGTMITYSILSTCITALQLNNVGYAVEERLRSGDIAIDLLKPLSYPLSIAADGLGTMAFQSLFTFLPTFVIAVAVFGLEPPVSALSLLGAAVAALLALVISFGFGYLFALLGFRYLTAHHFNFPFSVMMGVFGGQFLPLWFFPSWLSAINHWLPFQYMYFVPVAIYLGRISRQDLGGTVAIGGVWAVALLLLTRWLWTRAMRRLVIQGG